MKLLLLDTSTSACTVALLKGEAVHLQHHVAPMQHAKLILPMIDALLKESHLTCADLDAVAYGVGPGSFTGTRIANSTAQGIGFACQLPIVPLSSLACLAQTAVKKHGWQKLLVAVDARMNQIYWAKYVRSETGEVSLVGEEQLSLPSKVTVPADGDWYAVGDAWEKYASVLETRLGFRPVEIGATLLPEADACIGLARAKFEQGGWIQAAEATPNYLVSQIC
ncbi:MAG TPA: tRNA (adenosine(37)-N6)-threonylcarbamoyltransferase complex dimerization subunit type 1 TsaB [Gammaproteobacteria bacterium]|jgi:tRNA threonylcarbamoyladenosine biosynthesis protein TsaB|nr:tRNA (adenosine(37)-N6)-threonylcarbamoyltransferase complex dimerization subunit type 1 TsaB [Gammaproteobacteria bacterium]